MPLETINIIIGLTFLAVWAMIGRILIRSHHH
jgi:hypothetical protein